MQAQSFGIVYPVCHDEMIKYYSWKSVQCLQNAVIPWKGPQISWSRRPSVSLTGNEVDYKTKYTFLLHLFHIDCAHVYIINNSV